MTPATERTDRDLPRLAFFALGALFFGLAVADRLVALFAVFGSLVLTIFLAWLLAFLVVPLVDSLVRRLHLRRGIAVAIAADQAEEMFESEQAARASMDGPPELPLVGGPLVPKRRAPGPAANDMAS
jgi:hypothetical protein